MEPCLICPEPVIHFLSMWRDIILENADVLQQLLMHHLYFIDIHVQYFSGCSMSGENRHSALEQKPPYFFGLLTTAA